MYRRAACPEILLLNQTSDSGMWQLLKGPRSKAQFPQKSPAAIDCLTAQSERRCRLSKACEEAGAPLAELAHVPLGPLPNEPFFRCVPEPIAGHFETLSLSPGQNRPVWSAPRLMNT